MRLFEHNTTIGNTSTRVEILGISIPLPFTAADEAFVIPAEDDQATLARLDAIMSDRVSSCPRCGRETHICEAIGCDIDDLPLLAAANA